MPKLITIQNFKDNSGSLSVIENQINFPIRRVYYINDITGIRGGHKHKKTTQFFICLHGSVQLICEKNEKKKKYILSNPKYGVLIKPSDWHTFKPLEKNSIVLVLASHKYSKNDYIYEK